MKDIAFLNITRPDIIQSSAVNASRLFGDKDEEKKTKESGMQRNSKNFIISSIASFGVRHLLLLTHPRFRLELFAMFALL